MIEAVGFRPPLLAVITVVRNDLAGLLLTYGSLRAQGRTDFDWLVVDGGSTDGGGEWLADHRGEIAWLRSDADEGPYHAMTLGLQAARSEYVLFLNAGDRLAAPDTLAAILGVVSNPGRPDFVYGDALEEARGGGLSLKPARHHRHAWYGMFTHHQAMIYRRAVVADLAFDARFPIGADYAFTLQALSRSQALVRMPRPLCVFAAGGRSQRLPHQGRRDQYRIRREILGFCPLTATAIRAIQWTTWSVAVAMPSLARFGRCGAGLFRHSRSDLAENYHDLLPTPRITG